MHAHESKEGLASLATLFSPQKAEEPTSEKRCVFHVNVGFAFLKCRSGRGLLLWIGLSGSRSCRYSYTIERWGVVHLNSSASLHSSQCSKPHGSDTCVSIRALLTEPRFQHCQFSKDINRNLIKAINWWSGMPQCYLWQLGHRKQMKRSQWRPQVLEWRFLLYWLTRTASSTKTIKARKWANWFFS